MDWGRFAEQMASMARDLLAQGSMPPCSGSPRLTKPAHGYDAAGILVLHDSKVTTLAPTHRLVIDSDRLQECFDAARSGQGERVFRIADLADEHQRLRPQARRLGTGSIMSITMDRADVADHKAIR
ncbi:hypothetical protein [Streptomyces phaeofaciens]|uniref:hypothetical protein n=1 Tax=Streptomyces phaeofaciens TaxID=68254 RepID=UPI0036B5FDB0